MEGSGVVENEQISPNNYPYPPPYPYPYPYPYPPYYYPPIDPNWHYPYPPPIPPYYYYYPEYDSQQNNCGGELYQGFNAPPPPPPPSTPLPEKFTDPSSKDNKILKTPNIIVTPTPEDQELTNEKNRSAREKIQKGHENLLDILSKKLNQISVKPPELDMNISKNDKKYVGDGNKDLLVPPSPIAMINERSSSEIDDNSDEELFTSTSSSTSSESAATKRMRKLSGSDTGSREGLQAIKSVTDIKVYDTKTEVEDKTDLKTETETEKTIDAESDSDSESDDSSSECSSSSTSTSKSAGDKEKYEVTNVDSDEEGEELSEDEEQIIIGDALSVILEESEAASANRIRRDSQVSIGSTLSDSTTIANDDDDDDDDDVDSDINEDTRPDDKKNENPEENQTLVTVRLPLRLSFSRSSNDENITTVVVGDSEIEDENSLKQENDNNDNGDTDVSATFSLTSPRNSSHKLNSSSSVDRIAWAGDDRDENDDNSESDSVSISFSLPMKRDKFVAQTLSGGVINDISEINSGPDSDNNSKGSDNSSEIVMEMVSEQEETEEISNEKSNSIWNWKRSNAIWEDEDERGAHKQSSSNGWDWNTLPTSTWEDKKLDKLEEVKEEEEEEQPEIIESDRKEDTKISDENLLGKAWRFTPKDDVPKDDVPKDDKTNDSIWKWKSDLGKKIEEKKEVKTESNYGFNFWEERNSFTLKDEKLELQDTQEKNDKIREKSTEHKEEIKSNFEWKFSPKDDDEKIDSLWSWKLNIKKDEKIDNVTLCEPQEKNSFLSEQRKDQGLEILQKITDEQKEQKNYENQKDNKILWKFTPTDDDDNGNFWLKGSSTHHGAQNQDEIKMESYIDKEKNNQEEAATSDDEDEEEDEEEEDEEEEEEEKEERKEEAKEMIVKTDKITDEAYVPFRIQGLRKDDNFTEDIGNMTTNSDKETIIEKGKQDSILEPEKGQKAIAEVEVEEEEEEEEDEEEEDEEVEDEEVEEIEEVEYEEVEEEDKIEEEEEEEDTESEEEEEEEEREKEMQLENNAEDLTPTNLCPTYKKYGSEPRNLLSSPFNFNEKPKQHSVEDLSETKKDEETKISVRDRIAVFEAVTTAESTPTNDLKKPPIFSEITPNNTTEKKKVLSRNSSLQKSESEFEEDDSGVTDMSKPISETDTESESFPELRKMTRYQRAATHSRLFKLLQDESSIEQVTEGDEIIAEDNTTANSSNSSSKQKAFHSKKKIIHNVSITRKTNPEAIKNAETMSERRERLSLPLKKTNSIDADNLSTSNSPSSPITTSNVISDKLVNELVQSLLLKKKSRYLRSLPMEKLQAAAKRVLEEDLDSLENTSIESTPALTPQEFKTGQTSAYTDYYESWNCKDGGDIKSPDYDILPSKAFRNLQEQSISGCKKPWGARCPRVLSSKTINRDLATVTETPEMYRSASVTRTVPEKHPEFNRGRSLSRLGV